MLEPVPAQLGHVTKRFGPTLALRDFDLEVRRGETLALLGPNGAGKTTALRILLGIIAPDSGRASILGGDPRRFVTRRHVGAMLQVGGVPPTLTVRELVALFSTYYPRPLPLEETLERAGLVGLADRRYGELSGGQAQRTRFALAICGDPELLVLDEPTNALDFEARRLLWTAIRGYVSGGRAVLLATHDLAEAERLGDRIAILRAGTIVADASPSELVARTAAANFEQAILSLAGIDAGNAGAA